MNYPTILPPGQVRYPLVSVENVYIFPGIPTLLQRAFNRLKDDLFTSNFKSYTQEVFVTKTEVHITDKLNQLVNKYKNSVTFGSYPTWTHNYYNTKLTIESDNQELTEQVMKEIQAEMPTIDFDKNPFENTFDKIASLKNTTKVSKVA